MKERLSRYITHDILNQERRVIADGDDLLGSGLLDSLSVMTLVHYIEQELHIAIPPEDVTIENFVSLAAIERYLAARGAGQDDLD